MTDTHHSPVLLLLLSLLAFLPCRSLAAPSGTPPDLDFHISGYRYIKYRSTASSGDTASFLSSSGLSLSKKLYEQGTDLHLLASLENTLSLSADFRELPGQDREMSATLATGKQTLSFGDIPLSLPGGGLSPISKRISGFHYSYSSRSFDADFAASMLKSNRKSISFPGDGTHGPYSLKAFRIVEHSESILLNGSPLPSGAYSIDYFAGTITFCTAALSCTPIRTSDTIQITFDEALLPSQDNGALTAISTTFRPSPRHSLGISHTTRLASTTASQTQKSATCTFPASRLSSTTIDIATLCPQPDFFRTAMPLIAAGFLKISINGSPVSQYTIPYDGLARGIVTLASLPAPSDSITIAFSYYPAHLVQTVATANPEGKLRSPAGAATYFQLPRATIFPGAEQVYLCTGDPQLQCDFTSATILTPATHYTILAANNAIQFNDPRFAPSDIDRRFIHIAYIYIPPITSGATPYDHTVTEFFTTSSLGPSTVSLSLARSSSDISATSISVTREPLATFAAPAVCSAATPCSLALAHSPIVELSETIRLSNSSTPLTRGTQYSIDYSAGTISITAPMTIDPGSAIYADYQYHSSLTPSIETGSAALLTASIPIRSLSAQLSISRTDPFFNPHNGRASLETARQSLSLSGSISPRDSLSLSYTTRKTAADLFQSSSTDSSDLAASLSHTSPSGLTLSSSLTSSASCDSLSIHTTDYARQSFSLSVSRNRFLIPSLFIESSFLTSSFTDTTKASPDTSAATSRLALKYSSGARLTLSSSISSVADKSTPHSTQPLTTRGIDTFLSLSLRTGRHSSLSAISDRQKRSSGSLSGRESTSASYTIDSFRSLKAISFSYSAETYPDTTSSNTLSRVFLASFSKSLPYHFTLTPSHTATRISSSSYLSSSSLNSLQLSYSSLSGRISARIALDTGRIRSDSQSGAPDTASTTKTTTEFRCRIRPATTYSLRLTRYSRATTANSSDQTHTIAYSPSPSRSLSITYTSAFRTESSSRDESLSASFRRRFSGRFSWNTRYAHSSRSSSSSAPYTGSLLETELRADF